MRGDTAVALAGYLFFGCSLATAVLWVELVAGLIAIVTGLVHLYSWYRRRVKQR